MNTPQYARPTMTDFDSFVEKIRTHYLTGYTRRIQEYRQQFGQMELETLAYIEGREKLPAIYRLHRMDLTSNSVSPPDITEFNPSTHINFPAISLTLNEKLKIRLEPFLWNEAEIECSNLDPTADYLQQWGNRWISPEKRNQSDQQGLGGYAHSISYPEKKVNKIAFYVDFGSSPAKSFEELMGVLMLLGVKKVRIRTPDLKPANDQNNGN